MKRLLRVPACFLLMAGIAGCAANGPSPDFADGPVIRQTAATAPADLQLLCSATAARRFNIAENGIIPVSSGAVAANAYQVNMRTSYDSIECVVNDNGEILELARV